MFRTDSLCIANTRSRRFLCGLVLVCSVVLGPYALGDDVTQLVEEIKASTRDAKISREVEFPSKGYISDPDGFTNVRSGPGSKYPIVAVIRLGEPFQFRSDGNDWWRVKTASGTVGFIHSSRVSRSQGEVRTWIFADSSVRELSPREVNQLSIDDLWRARNEIFARRGLIFQTEKGKRLAKSLGVQYKPVSSNQQTITESMNVIERRNISLIESAESASSAP